MSNLRFYLPATAAAKWQLLQPERQRALYAAYTALEPLGSRQDTGNKARVVCYVSNVELAPDAPLLQLSLGFASYVTEQLRGGTSPVGELAQTAAWAAANLRDYQLEVVCDVGRIDVVSEQQRLLIEAKFAGDWKAALGQVLAYRSCYELRRGAGWQAQLLLLGRRDQHNWRLIEQICAKHDVAVVWSSASNN